MVEPRTLRTHPELRSQVSFPLFKTLGGKPKSRLENALSLFADVRGGEGAGALLMTLNVFILLAAYYLLKPAREALILTEGGAEVKAYASAAQALLLLLVVPLYGWLGTKMNRLSLVAGSNLFFALNLVAFWFLGQAGAREGVVFFIWLGIFNAFVISQFWAFANDIYTEGQGRRLFPFIGIGSSLGAWWGATSAKGLVENFGLSPYQLMAIAAVLLTVSICFVWLVNHREKRDAEPGAAASSEQPLGEDGGFRLIFQDRYLLWIAVLTVLLNVVNTGGEYILGKLVETESITRFGQGAATEAARRQFIGAFYGGFFGWVNLLGFLLQAGAVSRIMRFGGVRGSLFVLPCLSFTSYALLAGAPILGVVRLVKILENSTDYSLQNTVTQALWLPASREAKYKAKAAVDTFFKRSGDVLAAGIVAAASTLGAGIRAFALLNVLLTAAWLWVAWQIRTEHLRRTL